MVQANVYICIHILRLLVTIFLGSRPVRSDVSVYQIFERRVERRQRRDSFPGRRIAKPNSNPLLAPRVPFILFGFSCLWPALFLPLPRKLDSCFQFRAEGTARRKRASEFLCFFPLCLRPPSSKTFCALRIHRPLPSILAQS